MHEWQHLLETLDPIAFSIGFFSVSWYALFFLLGLLAAYWFFASREGEVPEEHRLDLLVSLFVGAVIGARLGYVLFYGYFEAFLRQPWLIISPYDFEQGVWTGIAGLSFHGGLIGAVAALFLFTSKKRLAFWIAADQVALAVPIALFFGRLGNFFNLELYGRITERPWGMIFPGIEPLGGLRYPASLYEAFLEGVCLFLILLFLSRKKLFPGAVALIFLIGYAVFRFIGEYFREPDPQIGLLLASLSLGQLFSLVMLLLGLFLYGWLKNRKSGII